MEITSCTLEFIEYLKFLTLAMGGILLQIYPTLCSRLSVDMVSYFWIFSL